MKKTLSELAHLLEQKSEDLNLFSAQDRKRLQEKHFPDALEAVNLLPKSARLCLDLGTGGGVPGLVLAVDQPQLKLTLLDARGKKIQALQELAQALKLNNVQSIADRFETLAQNPAHREKYDVVFARAVAELPVLLEYAVGFMKVGGLLLAWKSQNHQNELESARSAEEILQMELESTHDYILPSGEARSILVFKKMAPTDKAYPRKVGQVKKRPL